MMALGAAGAAVAEDIDYVPDGITVTPQTGGWYYVQARVRYDAAQNMTSMSPRLQIKKNTTIIYDADWTTGDITITSSCPGTNPCTGTCQCGTINGYCNDTDSANFCICANCAGLTFPSTPGVHVQLQSGDTIRVLADVDNEYSELNETNNTLTLNL
jgi:hypothetical protein